MPLYEGKTVGEAMRKALGIETKKAGKYLGKGKPAISKLPGQRRYDKPRNFRKQNDRFPFATASEIESARRGAKTWARNYISSSNVSEGQLEDGCWAAFDMQSGRTIRRSGAAAGTPSENDFNFNVTDILEARYVLLVTAHSHVRKSNLTAVGREQNRANRRPSRDDNTNLRPYAPMYIKVPDQSGSGGRVIGPFGTPPFRSLSTHPQLRGRFRT